MSICFIIMKQIRFSYWICKGFAQNPTKTLHPGVEQSTKKRYYNNRSLKSSTCLLMGDYEATIAGTPPKAARIALGALIIQENLGLTDEEVVEQIWEIPHMQYFIGSGDSWEEEPFEVSMLVHFQKRLNLGELGEFGTKISMSLVEGYTFIDRMSWSTMRLKGSLGRESGGVGWGWFGGVKLAETNGSMIGMAILAMNLEKLLREDFLLMLKRTI